MSIVRVRGVPTVDPCTALAHSAAVLPLRELIVAADHLRRPRGYLGSIPPLATAPALMQRAHTFHGTGAQLLRTALDLSAAGAESRMETLTRLLLVACGIDHHFVSQVELSDPDGWIGRFDFVCHARRLIVEYDGEQHRTSHAQYRKDLARLDRLHALGYRIIRLVREDVLDTPHTTGRRIATALGAEIRAHPRTPLLLA